MNTRYKKRFSFFVKKSLGKLFFLFFIVAVVALFIQILLNDQPELASKSQYVRVAEIIDGDTIVLTSGVHVRYIGLDTPEMRHKKEGQWVYQPEPYALEAKDYNAYLLARKRIRLEFDYQRRDRYDRVLAYVYLEDGTFVNAELLKAGLACPLNIRPNTRYRDYFKHCATEAKKNKKGMWG